MDAGGKNLPLVVVVEDDPFGLQFLESSLSRSGYEVISATSIAYARKQILQIGLSKISLVLTDYKLPDGNGLDLIRWIRQLDTQLATVVVTAQGEKSVIQDTMHAGAVDYLEKPITHQILQSCLKRATEHTRKQRKYESDQKGLEALEHLDFILKRPTDWALDERLQLFYHPLHEAGGDFLNIYNRENDNMVILVGDVSGHDIRSGFVSTYFNGIFKGCIESGGNVERALELLNESLSEQAGAGHVIPYSLSLAILEVNPSEENCVYWNYGFSPLQIIDMNGFPRKAHYGNSPLGWMSDISTVGENIPFRDISKLVLYTDGMADYSEELGVNLFSLLYAFKKDKESLISLPTKPTDDILMLTYQIQEDNKVNEIYETILSEQYAGSEIDHIDYLQSVWRRSIVFALQDKLGDRLYDLLICVREGMINALTHGCARSTDKFSQLHISYQPESEVVRVRIDDPGKGHQFDLKKRLEEMEVGGGKHLGLGIIQHLSDDFGIENKGSSLLFDFHINPVASK